MNEEIEAYKAALDESEYLVRSLRARCADLNQTIRALNTKIEELTEDNDG